MQLNDPAFIQRLAAELLRQQGLLTQPQTEQTFEEYAAELKARGHRKIMERRERG